MISGVYKHLVLSIDRRDLSAHKEHSVAELYLTQLVINSLTAKHSLPEG